MPVVCAVLRVHPCFHAEIYLGQEVPKHFYHYQAADSRFIQGTAKQPHGYQNEPVPLSIAFPGEINKPRPSNKSLLPFTDEEKKPPRNIACIPLR
jgi:hypothetical protein